MEFGMQENFVRFWDIRNTINSYQPYKRQLKPANKVALLFLTISLTSAKWSNINKEMINITTNIVYADMPVTINAYTMHYNDDTYTIVLNSRHCLEQLIKAYHHEMKHIENGDYGKHCKNVQVVEYLHIDYKLKYIGILDKTFTYDIMSLVNSE
jgi:hypothetical protein